MNYLQKLKELLNAFQLGKTIQHFEEGKWADIQGNISIESIEDYENFRVKPN